MVGADEFHRADAILLVVESRMATGIALYGDALRRLAAADVTDEALCEAIGQDPGNRVRARSRRRGNAAAGLAGPWCGRPPAVSHAGPLHAVLSAGLACGSTYQAFLDELLASSKPRSAYPPPASSADAHAGGAGR